MKDTRANLRIGVIRTRKIVAGKLQIENGGGNGGSTLLIKIRRLRRTVRELRHALRALRHELHHDKHHLEHQIHELNERVTQLENQLASGLPNNPALQAFFTSKLGQTVTVSTQSGTLTGTVTVSGTNAVELTESNGDILIIPYSKITAVQ